MGKKSKLSNEQMHIAKNVAATYKESAQQIWLAGLGAFGKAQEQGTKVFDALVREGQALQSKTQALAQEPLSGAASKALAKANAVRDEVLAQSNVQLGKLEKIFEERVAKALQALGLPTQADIADLHRRIDALSNPVVARRKKTVATAKPRATEPKVLTPKAPAAQSEKSFRAPLERVVRKKATKGAGTVGT